MPFSHSLEKRRLRSQQIKSELDEIEGLIKLLEENDNIYIKNE